MDGTVTISVEDFEKLRADQKEVKDLRIKLGDRGHFILKALDKILACFPVTVVMHGTQYLEEEFQVRSYMNNIESKIEVEIIPVEEKRK